MPAPIDYGVQIADPTQSFLSAFQTGAGIQETRLKQEQQQQQMANQKLIQDGLTKLRQPGATAEDVSNLAMILPKDQSESVLKAWALKTDTQKQNALSRTGKVVSALFAGETDIAQQLINDEAVAMRNSGNEEGAKFLETWRGITEINPTATERFFTAQLLQLPGGDKIVENVIKLGAEKRAEGKAPAELRAAIAKADKDEADAITAQAQAKNAPEKAAADAQLARAQAAKAAIEAQYAEPLQIAGLNEKNWNIKNLQSQISDRAAKLNIDRQQMQATVADKLSSIQARLTDLPEGARKLINESATAAASSKQAATQYNDLANRIQGAEGGKGALTSATEWFAKSLGQQDAWTQIRNEYTRVRNSVAIKALPPGVATDKDIELALKGIPPENANATTLASFLRGTAKLQDIDSAINNAKTDWLSQNNGLLTRSKGTFIAGDYTAKPGETFNDFAQRIVGDVSAKYRSPEQLEEQRRQQLISQIPGQATPAVAPRPAPSPASIESQADAILRGGR